MHITDEGLEKCEPVLETTKAPGTCMGNQHMCWAPIASKPNVHTNHVSLNPVARQFILTLYYCPPPRFFTKLAVPWIAHLKQFAAAFHSIWGPILWEKFSNTTHPSTFCFVVLCSLASQGPEWKTLNVSPCFKVKVTDFKEKTRFCQKLKSVYI